MLYIEPSSHACRFLALRADNDQPSLPQHLRPRPCSSLISELCRVSYPSSSIQRSRWMHSSLFNKEPSLAPSLPPAPRDSRRRRPLLRPGLRPMRPACRALGKRSASEKKKKAVGGKQGSALGKSREGSARHGLEWNGIGKKGGVARQEGGRMRKHIDIEARVSAWTLGVETLRGWLRESTNR